MNFLLNWHALCFLLLKDLKEMLQFEVEIKIQ